MKLRLPSKKFVLSMFSALIAIAILLSVVPAVYAEGDDPLTPIPGLGRLPNATLISMHKKEGTWFNDQESLLKDANKLDLAFQSLITAEAKRGRDVSVLQEGLATFESEVAACREIHLNAGNIVFSLVGFKANGDVRDRLAAGQTLLDGRASLKDAHFRLTDAMNNLKKYYAIWRHTRISGLPPQPTRTQLPIYTPQP
jgi:hypothetical protein